MKLERKINQRNLRAGDLMRPPESLTERIFDPRLDLAPGEFQTLRDSVKREKSFLSPKIFKIPYLSWMTWFDPSVRDDLRGIDKYKNRQLEELRRISPASRFDNAMVYVVNEQLALLLQQFPELRAEVADLLTDDKLELALSLLPDDLERTTKTVVSLIQLWPHKRAEITRRAFTLGMQTVLSSRWSSNKLHTASRLLLIFPEHRAQLVQLVQDQLPQAQVMLTKRQDIMSQSDFSTICDFIGDLTLLGAKSAIIDNQGLIQVEFQPLTSPRRPEALPERRVF